MRARPRTVEPKSRAASRPANAAAAVARAFGVCERTVAKWVQRGRGTVPAFEDRSCRPRSSPRAIATGVIVEIERLRRLRRTGAEIAAIVGVSPATVSRTLALLGLSQLSALEARRKQSALRVGAARATGARGHQETRPHRADWAPITQDRRSAVRGIGWEYVHVCVDDCSRLAYVEVLPDERGVTVAAFMRRAFTWFRVRGVQVQRVLSDNGSGYLSHVFAAACQRLGVRHRRTRPYTPRTNGKAERFIRTLLTEWAYVRPFHSSVARTSVLAHWLHYYNEHRRHRALDGHPPISRLVRLDNVLKAHS